MCECKSVLFCLYVCFLFKLSLTVNLSLSCVDTQDFHPAPRSKHKNRVHFIHLMGPVHISHPQTSLLLWRTVSPTQKILAFHDNQGSISPEFHLLSSTVTLTTNSKECKWEVIYSRRHEVQVTQAPTIHKMSHRLQRAFSCSSDRQAAYHTYPLPDAV
jgi:hypothetical protein